MTLIEQIWIILSIALIGIILITTQTNSVSNSNNLSLVFSNASEGQKNFRKFTWFLVISFFILTLLISYLG